MELVDRHRRVEPALLKRYLTAYGQHFDYWKTVSRKHGVLLARVPARVNAVAGLGYVFTNPAPRARLLRPLLCELMRRVLNNPHSLLILQNNDDVLAFQQAQIADSRYVRLIKGSGVDTQRFQPAGATIQPKGEKRVLLASRLLWDKGIAEYVEAARQLRIAGLSLRFQLAGVPDPGNPASIPQAQLNAWEAEGVVELLGQVEDMGARYAQTDMVVLPSYREGLPKSLIEAAACGLPLVTTDVPGCREVVTNGIDGLIVPARDARALANAICQLHEHPEWARQLGREARKRAVTEFDERIVIEKTVAVYKELLPELNIGAADRLGD
ncbi:MAG: glycosyltransferase family 4 protein [Candidatus Competibacteraceae bacterium]|nr:glycosyltransferase family 4 protein [Candidatus Competibacteraceae bacterium]